MSDFKIPSFATRNPLGVIALFISLIYGMSALLLGATVSQLKESNQTALVIFIIVFPCAILWVFAWLVCRHHTKLYGPGDYRTDEGFLNAGSSITSSAVGKRLEAEVAEVANAEELQTATASEDAAQPSGAPENSHTIDASSAAEDKLNRFIFDASSSSASKAARAYFAEGLVFQALQFELRGSVRRDVTLGNVHVDGLVYEPNGTVAIIEIKILSPASKELSRRLRECRDILARAADAFVREVGTAPRPLLVLVVDGNKRQAEETRDRTVGGTFPFEIKVFSLLELRRQFGFDEPSIGGIG